MRISADERDPGHENWFKLGDVTNGLVVLLDGKELHPSTVVTVDDKAGIVVCAKRDEKGNLVVDGNEIVHETLTGKVEVTFRGFRITDANP